MAITPEELAGLLERNPQLRISRQNRPVRRADPTRRIALPEPETPSQRSQGSKLAPEKRKYRNQPVVQNGVRFDSKKEAARYAELQILERAGAITGLRLKPKYVFIHNGVRIGSFTPDFSYMENGHMIAEDVKGVDRKTGKKPTSTQGYHLRKRLLKAFFGLDVRET